jgi:hypothetical protein
VKILSNSLFLLVVLLVGSCGPHCEPWGNKSDRAYDEAKALYLKNHSEFNNIKSILDTKLQNVSSDYTSSRNFTWVIDSLKRLPFTNENANLLHFFESNGISSGSVISSSMVFFYPERDWENEIDSNCPAFSHEIVYVKNNEMPVVTSPNFKWYKIADYWYLRASFAQL